MMFSLAVSYQITTLWCDQYQITTLWCDQVINVFNYAKADFEGMSFYILDRQRFNACLNSTKVRSMWCHIKEDLMDVWDRFIPKINNHASSFPIWFTHS